MKTKTLSVARILLPTLLCCVLALPILSYSSLASAAKKPVSIPALAEQAVQSVNINKADAETLAQVLKGIGAKKAQAIVAWRQKNGNFKNVSQLLEVKGIGEKTLSANRSRIKL